VWRRRLSHTDGGGGIWSEDVDVVQQGDTLTISGQTTAKEGQQEVLHQGLAFRNFRQSFSLADHVKVAATSLEDGLLSINLVREVPEELKPRSIETGGRTQPPFQAGIVWRN
jgi:molecular chaperone IbpA